MANLRKHIVRPWDHDEEPPAQTAIRRGRWRWQEGDTLGFGEGARPCPSCGVKREPGEVVCRACGNALLTFLPRR